MKSRKGQLLIASPQLGDPNFLRSIVLIVQHDENGALGLILNRELEICIKDACEDVFDEYRNAKLPVSQGGPCNGPLMVLHDEESVAEMTVLPNVYFTTEKTKIEWLLKKHDGRMRFFAGYSGWGKQQLESEIKQGAWLLAPAHEVFVFNDGVDAWSKLITAATLGKWVDPTRIPDDPSVN